MTGIILHCHDNIQGVDRAEEICKGTSEGGQSDSETWRIIPYDETMLIKGNVC